MNNVDSGLVRFAFSSRSTTMEKWFTYELLLLPMNSKDLRGMREQRCQHPVHFILCTSPRYPSDTQFSSRRIYDLLQKFYSRKYRKEEVLIVGNEMLKISDDDRDQIGVSNRDTVQLLIWSWISRVLMPSRGTWISTSPFSLITVALVLTSCFL